VALQEVDGCWNAAVAECQHRRLEHNSPTGTVERGRSDTGELSLPAWITPDRWRQASSCSMWPRPRSNFRVPVTTRAAAFNTRSRKDQLGTLCADLSTSFVDNLRNPPLVILSFDPAVSIRMDGHNQQHFVMPLW